MKPTEDLVHDHTVILHMLSGAERLVQSIRSTRTVDVTKVEQVIDFSRQFTDRCHHSKEEKCLFVRLQERGLPADQGNRICSERASNGEPESHRLLD